MIAYRFLLVSLSIETILGETTIHRRKEKLKQMSSGQDIGDVYNATLERIRAQGKDKARLGMEAIMWVAYSERSLAPDELCEALGVEIGSRDLNSDNTPSIRTILNCTLGLVTVDSSSSKVRLVHFTLQEHILANPKPFPSPHLMIAEVCLAYLNFGSIRDLSPARTSPPPTAPFLEYASCYWGAHAQRETSETTISLAIKLLNRFDAHISCKLLLLKKLQPGKPLGLVGTFFGLTLEDIGFSQKPFDIAGYPIGFTGLHAGALLGVSEILASLLQAKEWDLNATDLCGNTALVLATRGGHDGIVKMLLEQEGVDPNMADNLGKTPLSWAAENGFVEIIRMLFKRKDVNPNTINKSGRTPFSRAAGAECGSFFLTALGRRDIKSCDAGQSCQALSPWGADCAEIVAILLERSDINLNTADKSGRTPFSWAAGSRCSRIVGALLEQNDINYGSADKSGRTPFSWAAESGCEEIVRMLLGQNDVNPNTPDMSGRTPLSRAAGSGHANVVELLLQRNDVNPDMADLSGRTPLSWAAGSGHASVVELLLKRDDVSPDMADLSGRTAFSRTTGSGHASIVELLLKRNDVNPDMADLSGRTPFSWAAERAWRAEVVVAILLRRSDVNPDSADKSGRTPLSWAAEKGGAETVRMLLERNDVNPNTPDKSGRTPFSWVSMHASRELTEMLLDQNNVNCHISDEISQTPFLSAAMPGNEQIVDMLPQRNNSCLITAKDCGRTPFPCDTSGGRAMVAPGHQEWHDLDSIIHLREEFSEPFITELSPLPEPPLKKIHRF